MEKTCILCKEIKSIELFGKHKKSAGGIRSYCKNCANIKNAKWRKTHTGPVESIRLKRKKMIVAHYTNNKMCCSRCGFSDITALSVDHINGDGNKHRKEIESSGLHRWLIKNNMPIGFQILCMNCNFIKRIENKEFGHCNKRKNDTLCPDTI